MMNNEQTATGAN